MNFELRKRKSWKNAGGVSEIVGNILILLITVVLFTGIMGFVQTMPVPRQVTKVDFAASMIYTGTGANVTITHEGGAVLPAKTTEVYVEVDTLSFSYILSTDPGFHYSSWRTGLDWTKSIAGIKSTSSVTVRVIDMQEHVVLWVSQLSGGTSGTPPSILQRYTDSNIGTPTPDPVKKGNAFSLFVRITDMDNDLNTSGIYVDATSIGMSKSISFQNGTGGWFRWDFSKDKTENVAAVDGKSLVIRAWDKHGHMSVANFVLQITVLPSDTYNNLYPAYTDLGMSGLPSYLKYVSDSLGHGFGIYGENKTNNTAWDKANTSDSRNYFSTHEMVFLRFASLSMSNLFVENRLTMTDIRTGISYTPTYKPSSYYTSPFYPYPTGGSAYVYECKFNTSGLPPGAYALSLSLKSQGTGSNPSQSFSANEPIIISDPSSPILPSMVPKLWVYKDPPTPSMNEWGTRDHPFELQTSGRNVIYVLVKVQNTNSYPPSPTVAEVRVTDMSGESEVYGVPPAGTMISRIKTFNSTCYNFTVDLRSFNGNQWLPGRNSYTLFVSRLNDTNEGVYSLSTQVWINGTGGKAEWFVGTYGMASGNSNFNTREYLYYIQNNNFFTSRVMYNSESTPSASTDYTVTALAAGDLDGDGDRDLLMAQGTSNKLFMFENTLSLYGTWQGASEISRPDTTTNPIIWIAFGDINGDGHEDFAYANSNSQIVLYNTTYGSIGWVYNPVGIKWSGAILKIDLKDITGDGKADLIVLAGGKIYIYDLKYSWDPTLSGQRSSALITLASDGTTFDFDVEDMDGNGTLDLLTAGGTTAPYAGGGNGVNVNYYSTQNGNQKNLSTSDPFTPTYGNRSGLVTDTKARLGNALRLQEDVSGGNPGKVSATLQFATLNTKPDQILRIYAKIGVVGGGTPAEVFYVWYSTDGSTFVPIMSIDSTAYRYYNFSLPSSVANKSIYIRFTDSDTSPTSTSPQDYIDLDMVGIFTGEFKGFSGSSVQTNTYWKAVRGGNIDGTSTAGKAYREVVVAANDTTNSIYGFKVYYWNGVSWTYMTGNPLVNNTSFRVLPPLPSAKYPFGAATLFDVVDINGDGLSDVLVSNCTTTGSGGNIKYVSKVGFFMNLYSTSQNWRYFVVKSWNVDAPSGGAINPYIDIVVCTKLSVTG